MSRSSRNKSRAANPRVERVRTLIIASALGLAAVVTALGLWYGTGGGASGELVEGTHYRLIEDAPPRAAGAPIVVQEVFSYACVHCRNFDPLIEEWQANQADDVTFERIPAAFSPAWAVLAQAYHALDTLGIRERHHERLFAAIHDTGRQFVNIEELAEFVDGFGTTSDAFLAAARGPAVAQRMRQNERSLSTLGITGVPTLIVAGRYLVGMNEGRKTALDTVDQLIAQERAGATPVGATPVDATPVGATQPVSSTPSP
jgi:thiol:disulfide interchange protein DsbA